jgi:hypothetical protein
VVNKSLSKGDKMNSDKIIIADPQVNNNSPTKHLEAISRYIWEHKPAHIVHIGDHYDFPSLSSYSTVLESEGLRLRDDLEGGDNALKIIMSETNKRNKIGKKKVYDPDRHFNMGNHENRLKRFIDNHPVLQGCFDLEGFIESEGWTVHDYLDPHWIDDICFMHYMPNPESSRAVGGSIENKLNKFPHSFVHGHQQKYQYGRRQNMQGKPHFGVCAGSFYMHDEKYRGANNTEIRGFVHLKAYTNRFGFLDHDVEFVSLERLLADY